MFPEITLYTTSSVPTEFNHEKREVAADPLIQKAKPSFSSLYHTQKNDFTPIVNERTQLLTSDEQQEIVVLQPGKVKERLEIGSLKEWGCYRIAIITLGEDQKSCFSYKKLSQCLRRFFWKPLTLTTRSQSSSITVLVNINSAVNRLAPLGFRREEVLQALDDGSLIEKVFAKSVEKVVLSRFPAFFYKLRIINCLEKWVKDGELLEEEIGCFLDKLEDINSRSDSSKLDIVQALPFLEQVKERFLFDKDSISEGFRDFESFHLMQEIKGENPGFTYQNAIRLYRKELEEYNDAISKEGDAFQCSFEQVRAFKKKSLINTYESTFLALKSLKEEYLKELKSNLFVDDAPPFQDVLEIKAKNHDSTIPEIVLKLKEQVFINAAKKFRFPADSPFLFSLVDKVRKLGNKLFQDAIITIQKHQRAHNWTPTEAALITIYSSVLNCHILKAREAYETMRVNALTDKDIDDAISFLHENESNFRESNLKKSFFIVKPSFTLQHSPVDQAIYILFKTKLGKGSYKTVRLAMNMKTAEKVARVVSRFNKESFKKKAYHDFEMNGLLSDCGSVPSVIKNTFIELIPSPTSVHSKSISYMVEFYDGGSLDPLCHPYDYYSKGINVSPTSMQEKLFIARELLQTLSWLHNKKRLIHLDLKPDNIVCKRDRTSGRIIKIGLIDFGFTCFRTDGKKRATKVGTLYYTSPEQCRDRSLGNCLIESNDYPADNWAAGIILFLLLKKSVDEWNPLPDTPQWFTFRDKRKILPYIKQLSENWLPEPGSLNSIGHIIRGLLHPLPTKRLTARQALERLRVKSNVDLSSQRPLNLSSIPIFDADY